VEYHFEYQTGQNQPQSGPFIAEISPNLRELEALFATHNPKVAGSNPAPLSSDKARSLRAFPFVERSSGTGRSGPSGTSFSQIFAPIGTWVSPTLSRPSSAAMGRYSAVPAARCLMAIFPRHLVGGRMLYWRAPPGRPVSPPRLLGPGVIACKPGLALVAGHGSGQGESVATTPGALTSTSQLVGVLPQVRIGGDFRLLHQISVRSNVRRRRGDRGREEY
jgi:hypothetical protein